MLGEQVSEEPCGRCLALPAYWQLRGLGARHLLACLGPPVPFLGH